MARLARALASLPRFSPLNLFFSSHTCSHLAASSRRSSFVHQPLRYDVSSAVTNSAQKGCRSPGHSTFFIPASFGAHRTLVSSLETSNASSIQLEDLCSPESVFSSLTAVRDTRPLVHCITNFVSMEPVANTLLACGGAPAMIHALPEVEEFASLASALYVNIGTLSPEWVTSMVKAAHKAATLGRPWVLDPVGAGATGYRTEVSRELLSLSPTVVRGNASEIAALVGESGLTRGVDSLLSSDAAVNQAKALATTARTVVVVSGAVDYITDGSSVIACENGHPMLQDITATGCSVSSLVAAFVAARKAAATGPLDSAAVMAAAAHAMAVFGVSAEVAMNDMGARGPGSLKVALMDALYSLERKHLTAYCRLQAQQEQA